jgi:hypothetical protein
MWPLHPAPSEYESLLSWIERLAKAYGVSVPVFCKHALGIPQNQIFLLNTYPPEEALARLAAGTGIPIERLRDMTIYKRWERLMNHAKALLEENPRVFDQFLSDHRLKTGKYDRKWSALI